MDKQEPVAQIYVKNGHWLQTRNVETKGLSDGVHNIYTAPQSKPWVSLSYEEITALWCDFDESQFDKTVRAIEAKLKELNHD